jgi:hypothetical protein
LSNNTGNCGLFFLRSVGVSRGPFSGTATVQDRGEILKKNRSFLQCQRFVGDLGKYPCCKALAHGFSPSELQNVTEHFEGYIYPTSHLGGQQPWYEALMFVFLNLRLLRVEPAFSFVALITEFESCDTKTWRKEQTSAPLSGVERSRDCHWKGPLTKKIPFLVLNLWTLVLQECRNNCQTWLLNRK